MHEDAPGAWQLVCKIWCNWLKGFGRSDAECPKVSKNAKFWAPNFQTLNRFFCVFLFLDHYKTLQSSNYAYGGLIPGAGIKN